jgi:hypothetical protein
MWILDRLFSVASEVVASRCHCSTRTLRYTLNSVISTFVMSLTL